MSTFRPHLEVLLEPQRDAWKLLAPVKDAGMVLYGGTAVALQIGHRHSLDFDFFTSQPLDTDLLKAAIPELRDARVIREIPNTWLVDLMVPSGSVRLAFFGGISFGRVAEPCATDDQVLEVASLIDLLGNKLKVIMQRASKKDYVDILAILRQGVPLEVGLAAGRAMFGPAFSPASALNALGYFADGDVIELNMDERKELGDAIAKVRTVPELPIISPHLSGAAAN